MKRAIALLCAILLACLCCACGKKDPNLPPGPETSIALLTLYADQQPLRIVTKEKGVKVTLQMLEYEPTVGFLRPIADEWEEILEPGRKYEISKELTEGIPEYRLFVQQGENIAIHNLVFDGKDGKEVFEIEGNPWIPAPIGADSPMIGLCRTAAIAPYEDQYGYWYAIANAISTLRGVDLELEPDGSSGGGYRVPGWLVDSYAQALFPGVEMTSPLEDETAWVGYADAEYIIYPSWSTWLWAEYKSAKQNKDGTWDVTIAISTEDRDGTMDKVIKLAPNKAYSPDSPFEYHVVGLSLDGDYDPPEPAPPPPENIVGTWKASVGDDSVAYLEIYVDGMAGLYLGDPVSDQLYEIYRGTVAPADDTDINGDGVDYCMDMEFSLDWYIYESNDGTPVTGVPDSFKGTYTLRTEWEGDQHVLRVTTNEGDNLYGKKELNMLWVPKTIGGGSMVDIEAVG